MDTDYRPDLRWFLSDLMERPIQEDPGIRWSMVRILFGSVMLLMLVAAIIARDREIWLITGVMLIGFPLYFKFMQRQSLTTQAARAKTWVQTDDGLRCTYGEPPETETIRWEQIQRLRWLRPSGLLIFWRESGPRSPQFLDTFHEGDLAGVYRGLIRVRMREADEIAAGWLKHRGLRVPAEKETVHLRPRRSSVKKLSQRARSTVWLGTILGGCLMAIALWDMLQELPSASWPSTEGKMVMAIYGDIPWDGRHSKKGRVLLSYQYTVAGHDYTATQYDPRHETYIDVRDTARAYATAHPRSSTIAVYYDPRQPDHAVLKAGINWPDDGAFLLLGLFFFSFALFARFAMLAQAKPAARTQNSWLVKEYGA